MTDDRRSRSTAPRLAIAKADALLIGAGAGMGVDSGLPDFRGNAGFWKAYPPYQRLGLDFVALAKSRWFIDDPTLAWGFYGHRMGLYRETKPHQGYSVLDRWARRMKGGLSFSLPTSMVNSSARLRSGKHCRGSRVI